MSEKKSRFPWKMTIWSIILIAATILPRIFIADIEETTGHGLDIAGAAVSMAAGLLLFLSWTIYCLFFSGWKWWRRIFTTTMVVSIPIAFFAFVEIEGGDLNHFRWRTAREVLTTNVNATSGVDLSTESPGDFPGYLGPDQTGAATAIEIDAAKFGEAKILWKNPIGEGWSGFAARNGYAVTMEQRGEFECVSCYDIASGDLKWVYKHAARHYEFMGKAGPRATPTIHEGKVYAVGAVGNLVCLNGADGSVVWQKDLNEILGITLAEKDGAGDLKYQFESNTSLTWGRSGSPLIVDNTVVVPGGGPKPHTLLAFDRATGELKWKGGDQMIGYATPTLATLAGRRQIIITAEAMILGVDASTGEQLWTHPRPGQSSGMANTSQLTVISDTQILSAKGYPDGGGELLTLASNGDKVTATSEWKNTRVLKTKLNNPILYDGHVYALSNGFMECTRVKDGERQWKQRGRFGHGQLLLVGDKLLIQTERSATLLLVQPSPNSYQQVGELDTGIDGICWNTLCLSGNKVLLRSDREAVCVELPTIKNETPAAPSP